MCLRFDGTEDGEVDEILPMHFSRQKFIAGGPLLKDVAKVGVLFDVPLARGHGRKLLFETQLLQLRCRKSLVPSSNSIIFLTIHVNSNYLLAHFLGICIPAPTCMLLFLDARAKWKTYTVVVIWRHDAIL